MTEKKHVGASGFLAMFYYLLFVVGTQIITFIKLYIFLSCTLQLGVLFPSKNALRITFDRTSDRCVSISSKYIKVTYRIIK